MRKEIPKRKYEARISCSGDQITDVCDALRELISEIKANKSTISRRSNSNSFFFSIIERKHQTPEKYKQEYSEFTKNTLDNSELNRHLTHATEQAKAHDEGKNK